MKPQLPNPLKKFRTGKGTISEHPNPIQTAAAMATPEDSLNSCQKAVMKQANKFIEKKVEAVGACLQEISKNIIKKNNPGAAGAAKECIEAFRKLGDSRSGKSLAARLTTRIEAKCDPSQPVVTHTLADILGTGSRVLEPIGAENLNEYCARFGGDGSLDDLTEWIGCIGAASEVAVDVAVAAQYPRALEWLELVRPEMAASAGNPTKTQDALAALDAVFAAIDGDPAGDLKPDIAVGVGGAGSTIFPGDGFEGPALRYQDNGDGTISDLNTGLMWEQKVPGGSNADSSTCLTALHGVDSRCTWAQFTGAWIAGYAGFNDWRPPNVRELLSIVDYGVFSPSIDPIFGPTILSTYWSSTTAAFDPPRAWPVVFITGGTLNGHKDLALRVRAVRGGR